VRGDLARTAPDIGDWQAIGHEFRERGEHRAAHRVVVEQRRYELGVVVGDGVVGRPAVVR
jgi:hypothetical protein